MAKYIGIFIDDKYVPEDVNWVSYPSDIDWYVIRRMNDFLFFIFNMEEFDNVIISFDHDIADTDLNGHTVTGYDCLKSLVEFCFQKNIKLPICMFHTTNSIEKDKMEAYYIRNCIPHEDLLDGIVV